MASFSKFLLTFSTLIVPFSVDGGVYEGCKSFTLTDSRGMSASYDLSHFNLKNEVFQVTDAGNRNFVYDFNICGAIDTSLFTGGDSLIPQQCAQPGTQHGPCIEYYTGADTGTGSAVPQCKSYEDATGEVPSAVQIEHYDNVTRCYWLGMGVENAAIPEYNRTLLDPDDAGKGVVFTILNGEWCESVGRNRELRVKLECPDTPRIEFEPSAHKQAISVAEVNEVDTCIYELAVQTPLACPIKCISMMNIEMYAVCATNGICEADPYADGADQYPNGHIRCLCDEGWNGTVCAEQLNELTYIDRTHPGLLAAIVICIVLLGVAIVMAAVLCHKIRMSELEQSKSSDMVGMLTESAESNLDKMKADAMTMDIGSSLDQRPQGVQLQTIDNQLETDRDDADAHADRNELLDDGQDDQPGTEIEQQT